MFKILLAAVLATTSTASLLHAQATPVHQENAPKWQVGVGGGAADPDYTPFHTATVYGYGTYNFLPNFGLDARTHYVIQDNGVHEYTVASGPRFNLPLKRFDPYIGGLIGYGHFSYNHGANPIAGSDSFIISYAAGLDLRATKHIKVRLFDIEYQSWTNFLPDGLNPKLYSAGIAYSR